MPECAGRPTTAAATCRRTLVAQPVPEGQWVDGLHVVFASGYLNTAAVRGRDREVGVEALGVDAPPRRGLGSWVRLPDRVLFGPKLRPGVSRKSARSRVRGAGAPGAGRRGGAGVHLKRTLVPAHLALKLPVRRLLVRLGRHCRTATRARPAFQIGCWCRWQAGAPAPGTPTSPARGRPGWAPQ